jgi:LysR family glycine cleavage system transcriptional activator/LysR family transcriptional regulator of beta-lactamase
MRKHQPLTALRAFEAVARLKSISAAADELRVTRPAVSKQVTLLEATLEVALLARSGNAIRLTPAGEELFEGLRRAFDIMSSSLEAVGKKGGQSRRLRVLVCRDFASSWLAGRVGAFLVENPGISLEIIAEKNGTLRLDENFDFRIFYGMPGQHVVSGLMEEELCRWIDMPVCTSTFAQRYLGGDRKPSEAPCLIDANYDAWDDWCLHTGFDAGGPRKHTTIFNETTLCLSVATSGGGLTIGDSFLTLPAILAGNLIVPFPVGLLSAQTYSLFTSAGNRPTAAARTFGLWLKNTVQAYQDSVLRTLAERNIKVVTREERP